MGKPGNESLKRLERLEKLERLGGIVTLGDVCEKGSSNIAQKDLQDCEGEYPIYGASGLISHVNFYKQSEPYIAVVKDGAGIGRVMLLPAKSSVIGTMQYIFPIDREVIDLKYLYHAMCYMNLAKYFSGATIPHIYFKDYKKEEIILPSLEEQKKVAGVLDAATVLAAKRRRQLTLLDTLTQSRFVEMFGTWPQNNKNWEIGTIKDVVSEVRYGSSRPAVVGGKYPYLRMNNITYTGGLDLTDIKYIDIPDNELDKCTVRKGDVLFNRTNSRELVGKTCVYDRDDMMVLAGFVIRVRVNERVTPLFLSAFLNTDFSKHMLFNMCKNAIGQANINAKELQGIGIYIPPISLQNEFAEFVFEVDRQKAALRRSLTALTTLKSALMQEYFGN